MADSLFPNYLKINPDGSIGATFSGDIEARSLIDTATGGQVFNLSSTGQLTLKGVVNSLGMTIPAGESATPTAPNEIQWIESSGGLVAEIGGYQYTPPGGAYTNRIDVAATATSPPPTGNTSVAESNLIANDSTGELYAQVTADVGEVVGQNTLGEVYAYARQNGGSLLSRLILNGAGNSDFALYNNVRVALMVNNGSATGSANFTTNGGNLAVVSYYTAYTGAAGLHSWGIQFSNGSVAGSDFYFNQASVHAVMTPIFFAVQLGAGSYSVHPYSSGVTVDANDRWGILIVELPS